MPDQFENIENRLLLETCIEVGATFHFRSNWQMYVWVGDLARVLVALGDKAVIIGFESCDFSGRYIHPRLDFNDTFYPSASTDEAAEEVSTWVEDEPDMFVMVFLKMEEQTEVDGVDRTDGPGPMRLLLETAIGERAKFEYKGDWRISLWIGDVSRVLRLIEDDVRVLNTTTGQFANSSELSAMQSSEDVHDLVAGLAKDQPDLFLELHLE